MNTDSEEDEDTIMMKNRNPVPAASHLRDNSTNEQIPKNDQAAELRRLAVVEMLKAIKEAVLFMYSPSPREGGKAGANGGAVERAAGVLATLKLAQQGLETFPADKRIEHALRSAERAIQEQEKRVAECERRQKGGR